MIKPLLSNVHFGLLDDGKYAFMEVNLIPKGVPRTGESDWLRQDNTLGIERAKNELTTHFRKYGFSVAGPTTVHSGYISLAIVSVEELRVRGPHLFGWTDPQILEMYTAAQQSDAMHKFPADELDRAKRLWSRSFVSSSEHLVEVEPKKPAELPIEGDYADALPNY